MRFHVGDRWADQDGSEWVLYWTNCDDEVRACNKLGRSDVFRYGRSLSGLRLTRLISSERWIPFAEMMPEPPQPGEKRVVVAHVAGGEALYLFRARSGMWVASDEIADWLLSDLSSDGAHWKYLTPPEASC